MVTDFRNNEHPRRELQCYTRKCFGFCLLSVPFPGSLIYSGLGITARVHSFDRKVKVYCIDYCIENIKSITGHWVIRRKWQQREDILYCYRRGVHQDRDHGSPAPASWWYKNNEKFGGGKTRKEKHQKNTEQFIQWDRSQHPCYC